MSQRLWDRTSLARLGVALFVASAVLVSTGMSAPARPTTIQDNGIITDVLEVENINYTGGIWNGANRGIPEDDIQDNAVNENKIADNSVGSSEIQDNAVTTQDIAAENITRYLIEALLLENIDFGRIAYDVFPVGFDNLAENSVDNSIIVDNGIISADIQDNSVENIDILDGTIDLTLKGTYVPLNRAGDNMAGDLGMDNNFIDNTAWVTKYLRIPASNLGRPPTNPPTIDVYGICHVAEFTVDTDKAYYKICIPPDFVSGTDIDVTFYWTRSATGSDESGKRVNWQLKHLIVTMGENVSTGESSDNMEDIYDDADAGGQIAYQTDAITITGATAEKFLIMEISAIASEGTDLSEPALLGFCISYTAYQVQPPS